MTLLQEINNYCRNNKMSLGILALSTILSYGYFITNWTFFFDDEFYSFENNNIDHTFLLGFGRFFTYMLDIIDNHQSIPFWNAFIAVSLLFISTIIWLTTLSKIKDDKKGLFIFSLLYVVSPIYAFYLSFSSINSSIGIGITLISLASYFFSKSLYSFEQGHRFYSNFFSALLCLYLSIGTYQMFAAYWISSFLLVANFHILFDRIKQNKPYARALIQSIGFGLIILAGSLLLYQLTNEIIYLFIPKSSYIASYISWGKHNLSYIISELLLYFKRLIILYHFNFFYPITLIFSSLFLVIILINNYKNYLFILSLILFFLSSLFFPLILGTPLPLRTMANISIVIAGMWLFIYVYIENKTLKKWIFILVCISSFFNAQYTVRLFYGSHMKLLQDINVANQLYNFLLNRVGSNIYTKPLVIVGKLHSSDNPFIIKSDYDALGVSFFEMYDEGFNGLSKYYFMEWLGNHSIYPSKRQEIAARHLSIMMDTYPNRGAIKETQHFIVLKLGNTTVSPSQKPIILDEKKYTPFDEKKIHSAIDTFKLSPDDIFIEGWAYFPSKNARFTSIYLKFKSDKTEYLFPTNQSIRPDLEQAFHDAKSLDHAGFQLLLDKYTLIPGKYRIHLVLINDQYKGEISTHKTIRIDEPQSSIKDVGHST